MRRACAALVLAVVAIALPSVALPADGNTATTADPPLLAVASLDGRPGLTVMTTSGNVLRDRRIRGPFGAFAVSPDGARIAYEDDQLDSFAVGVRTIGSRGAAVVVPRADDPAWSPDGHELAVDGYGPGAPHWDKNIFTVLPGQPKQLFYRDDAWDTDPTWSPDGKEIAFERDRGDGLRTAGGRSGLFITDGTARRLVIANDGGFAADPAWSPDGRQIAFDDTIRGAPGRYGEPTSDIYVINTDGTNLRQITFDRGRDDLAPHWSPDGRELAFTLLTPGFERSAVAIKTVGAAEPKCVLHPSWSFELPLAWLPGTGSTPPPGDCATTILPPRPKPKFGCTRAAARSAVDRSNLPLSLKKFAQPGPWGIVKHCVDFTGDGRQDLVVVFNGGGSGGNIAWAAFTRTRRDWRRVRVRYGDRLAMSVVGGGLVETYPVYRPHDSHADPTGGVAHREYGWNGHRLVVVARWHTAR